MDKNFVTCERCGKRLIERLPNGLWRFCFGRNSSDPGRALVEILIHGNLQIKCWRHTCRHINTLNYFPFSQSKEN